MNPADLLVRLPVSLRPLRLLVPIVPITVVAVVAVARPVVVIAPVPIGTAAVAIDRIIYRVEERGAVSPDEEQEPDKYSTPHVARRGRVSSGNCLNSVGGQRGLVVRKLTALEFNREWCRLLVTAAYIPASAHPTPDKHAAPPGSRSVPWSRIGAPRRSKDPHFAKRFANIP